MDMIQNTGTGKTVTMLILRLDQCSTSSRKSFNGHEAQDGWRHIACMEDAHVFMIWASVATALDGASLSLLIPLSASLIATEDMPVN